jgi:hypothetical protein
LSTKAFQREEDRWKRLEDAKQADIDRIDKLRELGLKSKKNDSGVAYDITNLNYMDNAAGENQRIADDRGSLYPLILKNATDFAFG